MSSAAYECAWRFLAKWFCDHGFVCIRNAAQCFFCVPTVIAGSVIAVSSAAGKHGFARDVPPTDGTSRVPKGGSTIATGSAGIAAGGCRRA